MRAHHDTILTIDLGGELARVIVHKIRRFERLLRADHAASRDLSGDLDG